ncbi:LOW QUALITY PROTEIN: BRCA2 and CDKN1A-interacting protein [Terrapene carolina triunguis]|nr:LOW QUALITY PROTEIN: BRCA2 and CDKN1A-interacting protein [Terrapene carolina triunguis]
MDDNLLRKEFLQSWETGKRENHIGYQKIDYFCTDFSVYFQSCMKLKVCSVNTVVKIHSLFFSRGKRQAEVQEESDDEEEEEDDEVFGFISLLNLTERKGTQCAEQIKELILSLCEKNCDQSMVEHLDKLLNDTTKPVGFLLNERFINVPPQIALPMHQQLQKELAETQRTNKPCGKCYYYLLISKTFTETAKRSSKKRGESTQQKEELMFANAEEEFFYEKALLKFSYSVQEESDTCLGGRWSFDDVPMKPLRTVMLIPSDRMNAIMDKLKEYLSV